MNISKDAWHVRVYLRAYAEDRTWLDPGYPMAFWSEALSVESPEKAAYMACLESAGITEAREARYLAEGTYRSVEEETLALEWEKACTAWCDAKLASYSPEKSSQVRSRLLSGKVSLCPYFWSVMYALIVYYGLVLNARRVSKTLDQAFILVERALVATWRPVMTGVLTATALTAAFAMQLDVLDTPFDFLVSYRQGQLKEALRAAEQERSEKRWALERQAQRPQWQLEHQKQEERWKREAEWYQFMHRDHPRLAQDTEARKAQDNYEFYLKEQAQEDQEWQRFGQSLLRGIPTLLVNLFLLVGFIVTALFVGGWVRRLVRQIQATSLWATIKSRVQAVRTFIGDTKEFVWAFLKARKEQVCPYLTVIDREHRV